MKNLQIKSTMEIRRLLSCTKGADYREVMNELIRRANNGDQDAIKRSRLVKPHETKKEVSEETRKKMSDEQQRLMKEDKEYAEKKHNLWKRPK